MIRKATPADCYEIAALHVLAWQQAYAELMPQTFLQGLDLELETRSEQWKQAISDGMASVSLDYDKDRLAGFAACGKSQDSDTEPTWGELHALYYLEAYWGTGRAEVLLNEALDVLQTTGKSLVTLWVLDGNSRAMGFYEKHGFNFDGKEKLEKQPGFSVREMRMRKRLDA